MAFYQFCHEQEIKASMEEVWQFISSPENLKEITPDHMGFDIVSDNLPEKMYPGMIIHYKVSPLFGIRTNWVTEITQVKDLEFFVDEQRVGPYRMWHHQHILEPLEAGVLMKDIITYSPPFGVIGAIANKLFIRNKLEEIFAYRQDAINKRFQMQELQSTLNKVEQIAKI